MHHRPLPHSYAPFLLCLTLALLSPRGASAQDKGYYRTPALAGDRIVFAAEGDLWSVPLSGGVANRLTTHPAEESNPAVSPDGKWIAFSAAYEGPTEVYVMPVAGGLPRRLTYEGRTTVTGWTPDGHVVYRTAAGSTLPDARLVLLDPQTGGQEVVPLAQAADGSWDKAGGTLFFTRLQDQGSRTKRYKGGTAQNIWRLRHGAAEAEPLTADFDGTSRNPMFWNGRVYFESDRDGTMNLWSMNPDGKDPKQLTKQVGWDAKGASLSQGQIVYQVGADLRLFDIAKNQDREVTITLASDFDQLRERWVKDPLKYLDAWFLSPTGDRLALTARGRVFVAPAERGRFVEVTRHSNVRYRSARFLPPGGNELLVLNDQSGEVEWWRTSAVGVGEAKQVSQGGKVLRMDGIPSPDGKWIAHWNHDNELTLTEIATGRSTQIAASMQGGLDRPAWSPDSRWLVYGKPADNSMTQLFLYSVPENATLPLTTDRYNSYESAWSPDGKWIYFLSDRNFQSLVGSPWGNYQPEPYWDRSTRIYAIATQPGLRSPFQPADELMPDTTAAKPAKPDSTAKSDSAKKVATARTLVDTTGIANRLYQLPIDPGNYSDLAVNDKRLFWVEIETSTKHTASLVALDIGNRKPEPKTILKDIRRYQLSGDGKKLAVRKANDFYVLDAGAGEGAKLDDAAVDLSGWTFAVDPREDYHQLFVESWRLERDYFYDPKMHGVNWDAMLKKYLPLVDRVRSRDELADLQSQMAAELSALHTFVFGGDYREGTEDVATATLGARLARDDKAGGWRVEHIYRADPEQPASLSPLARYGVTVTEGEVITAVNGASAVGANPGALLRNQAGKQVRLRVKGRGAVERDVIITPLTAFEDFDLRYAEWEYTRRLKVDSTSHGRIGYVHLRAMGSRDAAQWYREFYPQFDRQALIIDDRHNGGGNIDSWILEKLIRQAWMYFQPRVGAPSWNMQYGFRGHLVVLVDEQTGSDGEAFAEGLRRLGLGKVIGTRTWGGEIWLTFSNGLNDRGIVSAAEFGVYGPEGKWLIEGRGVEPDSVVDNLPAETFKGRDRQLEAAMAHLEALIRKDPRPVPPHPPYPNKSVPDNRP